MTFPYNDFNEQTETVALMIANKGYERPYFTVQTENTQYGDSYSLKVFVIIAIQFNNSYWENHLQEFEMWYGSQLRAYEMGVKFLLKVNELIETHKKYVAERNSYKHSYRQALEDSKDKKYTEEDMRAVFMHGFLLGIDRGDYSRDMEDRAMSHYTQPKPSWEVEFIDGKLKLT